jgi:hypothetical protein
MAKIDERTILIMDVVLEEVFKGIPHGGDHESRKHVAKKLMQSAKKGNVILDGLRAVGRDALQQLSARKSACTSSDSGFRQRTQPHRSPRE